jgi:hypothetical protein
MPHLAKSVHPLHVRSWGRHGADELLVETLNMFASFCGADAQELAEEILAMSPAVKKRYDAAGSSKSWLKAWEEEVDAREKEHPGGLMCEARFFKGRQKSVARRMSEAAMNHRMRIHMNGPDVEAFCRRELLPGPAGGVKYHASALCRRSKAHYRNRFGSKTLLGRERQLQRKKMKESDHAAISQYHNNGKKKGLKIGRMAHHLRQKRTQAVTKHTGKVSDIWPPYRTYT